MFVCGTIITFDLNFTRFSKEQIANLATWVDDKGGGLIVIGGGINTVEVTRPVNKEQMQPLLELFPVILEDERIKEAERRTDRPWRLTFPGGQADMEFLKLWEKDDKDDKVTEEETKGDLHKDVEPLLQQLGG